MEGKGVYTWADGRKYEGNHANGAFDDENAKYTHSNGKYFQGKIQNESVDGTYYLADGTVDDASDWTPMLVHTKM